LTNSELVLGKLLASVLSVLVMLLASFPLFVILAMLGGVGLEQIFRVFAVTVCSVLACGSLGSLVALWREKTFQALALTTLALVLWIAVGEMIYSGVWGTALGGISCKTLAVGLSPWRAILEASQPWPASDPALGWLQTPVHLFFAVSLGIAVMIDLAAIALVRVWNPSREAILKGTEEEKPAKETIFDTEARLAEAAKSKAWRYPFGSSTESAAAGATAGLASSVVATAEQADSTPVKSIRKTARTRRVWDNPVIWREIRTWAYGRKILFVRLAYLAIFALAAGSLHWMMKTGQLPIYGQGSAALLPLILLSLILVNAQAVTSLTSERDAKALDLLLVTDLSPREIVFGKLGGVFYNTKEMVVLPLALCVYLGMSGAIGVENLLYLIGGLLVMYVFVAVLGLHAGISYGNSASAIGVSLGTLFFLSIGVAACMRIMLAFSGSFQVQFLPFFAFMVLGGAGLYIVLGARNPSAAIGLASFLCPFATFYAITSYLLDSTLAMFFSVVAAYGFTTAAMLVPALFEFDIATGKAAADE
jgi:hypothetical protein